MSRPDAQIADYLLGTSKGPDRLYEITLDPRRWLTDRSPQGTDSA